MGSREQLNDVRSNRWALRPPCQAPTLFSEHSLLNLLQKGKKVIIRTIKTHVADPAMGNGSSQELLGWEVSPEVLSHLQPCLFPSTEAAGAGEGGKTSSAPPVP